MGLETQLVWNEGLGRYILTMSNGDVEGFSLFDAPNPGGPWYTIQYTTTWHGASTTDALQWVVPTKWIEDRGLTIWAVYSGLNSEGSQCGSDGYDCWNLIEGSLIRSRRVL